MRCEYITIHDLWGLELAYVAGRHREHDERMPNKPKFRPQNPLSFKGKGAELEIRKLVAGFLAINGRKLNPKVQTLKNQRKPDERVLTFGQVIQILPHIENDVNMDVRMKINPNKCDLSIFHT